MNDIYNLQPTKIVMYLTQWCGECRRARNQFAESNYPYIEVDIEDDELAIQFVEKINNGFRSVPTIIFPDGSILVEPANNILKEKLDQMSAN